MDNSDTDLCLNICDTTEEDLNSFKKPDKGTSIKTKKIVSNKGLVSKKLRAGVNLHGNLPQKKQIVKVKQKTSKRFEDYGDSNILNKWKDQHKSFVQNEGKCVNDISAEPLFTDSNFSNLNLHPHMVANLQKNLGINKLTTVQKLAIPVITTGRDCLIRSQTGSGKTLTYAVPVVEELHKVRPKFKRNHGIMAVIVVPTRELALQTYECFLKILKPYTWIVPGYLAGGEKRKSEKARLRKGVNILVSTPGRLVDHLNHTRNLQLQRVRFLVLDEADRMMELGYEKDISSIVSYLDECQCFSRHLEWEGGEESEEQGPRRRQTLLLSATLTSGVNKLAGLALRDPSKIDASGRDVEEDYFDIPQNIEQWYAVVPPKLRLVVLAAFIVWKCKMTQEKKMLVFCATQDIVDYLTELLTQVLGSAAVGRDEEVASDEGEGLVDVEFFKLHGNMSQKDRVDVFKSFRAIEAGVLFCTDVASRGLDLPRVDWVVQWTAPASPTDYVHRVGRTARAGHVGAALLFLSDTETLFLEDLHKKGIRLKEETVDRCLQNLFSAGMSLGMFQRHESRTVDSAVASVQLRFEDAVVGRPTLHKLGCAAFSSFVRFYAAYPKESRTAFCIRRLHLGHYAKGFALRDTPSAIGVSASGKARAEGQRGAARGGRGTKPTTRGGSGAAIKRGATETRSRMLLTSEYASGFDAGPPKKKKKK